MLYIDALLRPLNPNVVLAAQALGIPKLHAVLIDQVIDDHDRNRRNRTETITEVAINTLTNPAMYLGENIAQIMAFGRLLDSYTPDQLRYIHSHAPSSMWDYEKERKRANSGYKKPDYDFGYYGGKAAARLVLICTGVVPKSEASGGMWSGGNYSPARPTPVDLKYVDELAGFAINEIQTFGQKRGRQRLYFLPKFFDDRGKPLTLDWLKSHPAPNYSPKVFPESVA